MMDDLRVLKGSFKNGNSTADYVTLLVIYSSIIKIRKKKKKIPNMTEGGKTGGRKTEGQSQVGVWEWGA